MLGEGHSDSLCLMAGSAVMNQCHALSQMAKQFVAKALTPEIPA
jgi:hypothetical protein